MDATEWASRIAGLRERVLVLSDAHLAHYLPRFDLADLMGLVVCRPYSVELQAQIARVLFPKFLADGFSRHCTRCGEHLLPPVVAAGIFERVEALLAVDEEESFLTDAEVDALLEGVTGPSNQENADTPISAEWQQALCVKDAQRAESQPEPPVSETYEYPTPYMAWLVCLFFVLSKARREGLMSLEGDVDDPQGDRSMFRDFPQTLEEPYLEFATDLLRLAVSGNLNAPEVSVYVEHAIAGHAEEGQVNIHLLKTIWLTLWASMSRYAPASSLEFGRQAIPVRNKPKHAALQAEFRCLRDRGYDGTGWRRVEANMEAAVERFMSSLENTP